MKETEIAKYFTDYLSDYDLYFEIPIFQTDIVAKNGNILMAFEVKTSLNFKVIEQAEHNTHFFNYSYVCVPKSKDMSFQCKICEMFGVGLLTVDINGYKGHVSEKVKAKLHRHPIAIKNYVLHCLRPYCKTSVPGASASNYTTVTPFKLTVEGIVRYLRRHNGATMKEVYDNCETHYNTLVGAKSCLYQWIRKGVIKDFYFENGKLFLSETVISKNS